MSGSESSFPPRHKWAVVKLCLHWDIREQANRASSELIQFGKRVWLILQTSILLPITFRRRFFARLIAGSHRPSRSGALGGMNAQLIRRPAATVCRESSCSAFKIFCNCEISARVPLKLLPLSLNIFFWQRSFSRMRSMLLSLCLKLLQCALLYWQNRREWLICLDNSLYQFSILEKATKINSHNFENVCWHIESQFW